MKMRLHPAHVHDFYVIYLANSRSAISVHFLKFFDQEAVVEVCLANKSSELSLRILP